VTDPDPTGRAHGLLELRAESIVTDVLDTYPGADTEFDLYIENGLYADAPEQVFGVIDMGDTGQWVYQLVEHDRYDMPEWMDVTGSFNPIDVKQRILAKRKGHHDTDTSASG
jgi:hypothetical protein